MQEECVFLKLELHCQVQGDVFLECVHLYEDLASEEMIFKVMFHTGFIHSNILALNSDDIDIPWDAKYKLSKDFKVEVSYKSVFNMDVFWRRESVWCFRIWQKKMVILFHWDNAFKKCYLLTIDTIQVTPEWHITSNIGIYAIKCCLMILKF